MQFTGHNIEVSDALKKYMNDKLTDLDKRFNHITNVNIVFKVENITQIVEVNLHYNGKEVHVKADSEDMYKSMDMLIDKLFTMLTKYKEKLIDKHR